MNAAENRPAPPEPMPPARTRGMHLALLGEADDADLPPGEGGRQRVLDFVSAVAASGGLLEEPTERRTAQGILDYWVASLNNTPNDSGRPASSPVVARLDPFDPPALMALVARLQRIHDSRSMEDQALLMAMVMALFEPDDRRRQFRAAARSFHDWIAASGGDLSSVARAEVLAKTLLTEGIVIETSLPDNPVPFIELASSALIRHWSPLAAIARKRQQLREGAQLWKEHRSADASFFSAGRTDPYAAASIMLDPLERQFLDHRLRTYRWRAVIAAVIAVVLLTAGGITVYSVIDALTTSRKLAEEKRLNAEQIALAATAEAKLERGQRQAQIAQIETIRQAIELRDVEALRRAGITVPDDMFRPGPLQLPPAPVATASPPLADDDVCRGAIWVGQGPESRYVRPTLALDAEDWNGRTFITTSNLRLRRGTPDPNQQVPIGVIPTGTTVVARGAPVADQPTTGPAQYFIPVTAPGPSCVVVYIQYTGSTEGTQALADQLKAQGYTVPRQEELGAAKGLWEIRFYFPNDEVSARNLAKRVAGATGREIAVRSYVDWKGAKPPPGTVEVWVDMSSTRNLR